MHDTFQKALGPKVKIFSQAHLVAESLEDYLQRYPDKLGTQTKGKFLTTGDPMKVSQRATQFLKRSLTFESA
jgi:glutamate racemase